jgi:putative transposase
MEDLNVTGMLKNKHLSKAIAEQGFYQFISFMKYKSEKYGIRFIQADRFYPSSKRCSQCGNVKKDLKLKDRTYHCDVCGFTLDRDKNASINLANYQLA